MTKKTMLLASVLLGSLAAQAIDGSNRFGLLPVTSSTQRTLVAVPWCACGAADDQNISVSNLVKTANLTEKDLMHVVDTNGTIVNTWELKLVDGVKQWVSVNQVSDNNQVKSSPNSATETVARGTAVVLIRAAKPTEAFTFYLYGQVPTNAATSKVVQGSAKQPAYTFVGAPSTTAQGLNQTDQWTNTIGENDTIILPTTGEILRYKNSKWGQDVPPPLKVKLGEFMEYTNSIPVGTGFWYVSRGGSPTITWTDVPTK